MDISNLRSSSNRGAFRVLVLSMLICLLVSVLPAEAQFNFGLTVAAVEGEVLVGEPGNRIAPGFVYVYRADAGGWQEVQRLTRSEATNGDAFGQGLVADGDRLLIGAAPDGQGTIYVFERRGAGWIQVGRFASHDGEPHDSFGTAIAVSGDVALVGAAGSGDHSGTAYLYSRQGNGWRQLQALTPDDVVTDVSDQEGAEEADDTAEPTARFGAAVAIDGDWAMVGAPDGIGDRDRLCLPPRGGRLAILRQAGRRPTRTKKGDSAQRWCCPTAWLLSERSVRTAAARCTSTSWTTTTAAGSPTACCSRSTDNPVRGSAPRSQSATASCW